MQSAVIQKESSSVGRGTALFIQNINTERIQIMKLADRSTYSEGHTVSPVFNPLTKTLKQSFKHPSKDKCK